MTLRMVEESIQILMKDLTHIVGYEYDDEPQILNEEFPEEAKLQVDLNKYKESEGVTSRQTIGLFCKPFYMN